jgi:hypothetical protein
MTATCIDSAWLEQHPEFLAGQPTMRHPLDRAHPYPPGSGPPGQSCGTCAKLCVRDFKHKYFKCNVLKKFWTAGPATDVRKKDPACMSWEPRIDKIELITTLSRGYAGEYPPLALGSPMRRRLRRRTGVGFVD